MSRRGKTVLLFKCTVTKKTIMGGGFQTAAAAEAAGGYLYLNRQLAG